MQASASHLRDHYADLSSKPFFPGLIKYMASGPVVAMVWEGLNVVKTGRVMLGETNPRESKPGTIRGDQCVLVSWMNLIHFLAGLIDVLACELTFHSEILILG